MPDPNWQNPLNTPDAGPFGGGASNLAIVVDSQGRISTLTQQSVAIDGSQVTSGTISVANGGTGLSTAPAAGALLIGNGTGYQSANLNAGSGVSVTNGAGSITLANTGVLSVAASGPLASSGGQSPTVSLNTSGVSAGTYGTASSVSSFTVNQYGLLSAASSTPIAIAASQVTSGTFPAGVGVQTLNQSVTAAISGGSLTLALGEVVYLKNGGGSATDPAVDRAVATSASAAAENTIGLVSTVAGIANNQTGYVCTAGVLGGLNTNAYSQGDILYVSPTIAGGLTNVKPVYPNAAIPVGIVVVRNASQGAIYVDHSVGSDVTSAVKVPSLSSVTTLPNGTTTISSTLFNGVVYLPLDPQNNLTLTTPIDALTSSDYGRMLMIHNTSNTRTMTFTAGGTAWLAGGVNLVLATKSMVQFIWSPAGGGAGRWVQTTAQLGAS